MTTFDKHVIRRLLLAYAFLTLALIVFFILLHYLEYIDDFLDRDAPMGRIYTVYYPSYVPEIIRLVSPLAIFLSCLFVTGKLAQTMQMTALQTSGVSLWRILRPYALVAVVLSCVMIVFNGWIVPISNRTVLEFDSLYLHTAPTQIDISDIHRQNSPKTVVLLGYYDRRTDTAHRVSLQRFDDLGRLVERVDAHRMEWRDSLWYMPDVIIRTFSGAIETRQYVADLDTTLTVLPRDLARTERDIESMTIPMAADYVAALRRSGAGNLGRPEVGFWTKLSYPLANLVVVLMALPLAARRRRGGQTARIAGGLFLAFVYLAAQKLTEPFGYGGELDPVVTAFAPHAAFLLLAIAMLVSARK